LARGVGADVDAGEQGNSDAIGVELNAHPSAAVRERAGWRCPRAVLRFDVTGLEGRELRRREGEMPIKESFVTDIEEGPRLRGWITNAYAQIEFLLGDLILRCRAFPEYGAETATFTHSAPKRARQVRRMLQKSGVLEPFAAELTSIIDRFEERHETRNLLAHGFCEYLCTPAGDAGLQFQKWHRQEDRDDARLIRCFRLPDLEAEQESLVALSDEALHLFMRMHRHFGWKARPELGGPGDG
jgi:hypothetical protein